MKKSHRYTLMILGGTHYIIPVIKTAQSLNIRVITVDYVPTNPAHQYSDVYYNVSVMDSEEVLNVAQKENINGIMSFACDAGVITAAYIAEQLGLPFQVPFESAKILQDKGLFRKFLHDNGFNSPHSKRYSDINEPLNDINYFNWPVIVKPVDSAGSKGVTKVDNVKDLSAAINKAQNCSHCNSFIIEDFLTFEGYHSSTDVFTVNGKCRYISYSDQLFDANAENPYAPAVIIWPSSMKQHHQDYLTSDIQRLLSLLHANSGIYNIETCVGADGTPYIMEVSPRGGGCRIAQLQEMISGIRFIENEIRSAVGIPLIHYDEFKIDGCWCVVVVHSKCKEPGEFKRVVVDDKVLKENVKYIDIAVKQGDLVQPFTGGNMALGEIFLRANSRDELNKLIFNMDNWLKIELD